MQQITLATFSFSVPLHYCYECINYIVRVQMILILSRDQDYRSYRQDLQEISSATFSFLVPLHYCFEYINYFVRVQTILISSRDQDYRNYYRGLQQISWATFFFINLLHYCYNECINRFVRVQTILVLNRDEDYRNFLIRFLLLDPQGNRHTFPIFPRVRFGAHFPVTLWIAPILRYSRIYPERREDRRNYSAEDFIGLSSSEHLHNVDRENVLFCRWSCCPRRELAR